MARTIPLLVALVALFGLVTGCQRDYSGLALTIAAGSSDGVYYPLGQGLASAWSSQLGMPRPTVLQTAGTVQNIDMLSTGAADVAFSASDAIPSPDQGPRHIRALGRIYDDYVHVVVRAGTSAHHLADLRGLRVSIGPLESEVTVVAGRLLGAAGLRPGIDLNTVPLSLNDSIAALRAGTIDAMFWSGGLPTMGISTLAQSFPVRLLDLTDILPVMRRDYPVYGVAVVPDTIYTMAEPAVTTLVVPNFLLVTDTMSDDVAEALVSGLFSAQAQLTKLSSAALGIDVRSAIDTAPVPLHNGALAYYRSHKI